MPGNECATILLLVLLISSAIVLYINASSRASKKVPIHTNALRKIGSYAKNSPLKDYRIFVINMAETTTGKQRWALMQRTPFAPFMERVHAVNGSTYNFTEEVRDGVITTSWDYGKWKRRGSYFVRMTPGEIGVSLSHRMIWRKIVAEKIERAVILEDDSYKMRPDFEAQLALIVKHLPEDWDILLLSYWLHQGDNGYVVNQYISRTFDFVFMNAYIINTRGAHKLLQHTIDMPLDSWVAKQTRHVNVYRHNLQGRGPTPRGDLIWQGSEVSSSIEHTNNW